MISCSQFRSFTTLWTFSSSLYLKSSSIIEKVLILLFNFLEAIEANEPESTPPLKQNATGTSALVLNFTVSINSLLISSIASLLLIFLSIVNFGVQYFFILIFKLLLHDKFSE